MIKIFKILILTAVSILIVYCSSSTGPEPDTRTELEKLLDQTPRIDREAELAAMWLSDDLVAPESLYLAVRDGYSRIRSKYSNDIPMVEEATFFYNRDVSAIRIFMTAEGLSEIRSGSYTAWDSLNEMLNLNGIDTSGIMYTSYSGVKLLFNGRLNPDRLEEYYDTLENVEYANRLLIYTIWDDPQNFLPWIVDGKLAFLVSTPIFGQMEFPDNQFWYFKYIDGDYEYIGTFESTDSDYPDWWDEIKCAHINFNNYRMNYCDSISDLQGD